MSNNGVHLNREGARTLSLFQHCHPSWCTSGRKEKPNQLPITKTHPNISGNDEDDPVTAATYALGTVPGHNDVINVHELRQIVRGLKSKKAVGYDEILSEVYKFASERLLTIMSIFLSGCMLSGELPSTLMHVVIIPLL